MAFPPEPSAAAYPEPSPEPYATVSFPCLQDSPKRFLYTGGSFGYKTCPVQTTIVRGTLFPRADLMELFKRCKGTRGPLLSRETAESRYSLLTRWEDLLPLNPDPQPPRSKQPWTLNFEP